MLNFIKSKSDLSKFNRRLVGAVLVVSLGAFNVASAGVWVTTSNNNCKVYSEIPAPNETATWSGKCKDGYVEGKGVLQWYSNKKPFDTYKGGYHQGKMHGNGEYVWKESGDKYRGEWKMDAQHGKGVYLWADGAKYEGYFKDGLEHGQGVATWADGAKFQGQYKEGFRVGLGRLTFPRGNEDIASWQAENQGFWRGNTYMVQGVFLEDEEALYLEEELSDAEYAKRIKTSKK